MMVMNKDITTITGQAVIMHGVNCQGRMRSGVAKALYTKWPEIRNFYLSYDVEDMTLGKISPVLVEPELYVVNCWTQNKFGYDGAVYASADAIRQSLQSVLEFCRKHNIAGLYAPKIGTGLGGLNWAKDVLPVFEELGGLYPEINITICEYDLTSKKGERS